MIQRVGIAVCKGTPCALPRRPQHTADSSPMTCGLPSGMMPDTLQPPAAPPAAAPGAGMPLPSAARSSLVLETRSLNSSRDGGPGHDRRKKPTEHDRHHAWQAGEREWWGMAMGRLVRCLYVFAAKDARGVGVGGPSFHSSESVCQLTPPDIPTPTTYRGLHAPQESGRS